MKYSEYLVRRLQNLGYTHCFFLAGGNSMHLLDAARLHMTCTPFVHEVSAVIACEYFNALRGPGLGRAFVLVTAGPGLTNTVTGIAGAYLESREALIIGGQVKTTDLSRGVVRQRGIQEIDGCSIVRPVTKRSLRVEQPLLGRALDEVVADSRSGRPGPVFLEICLDTQAVTVDEDPNSPVHLHIQPHSGTDEIGAHVHKITSVLLRSTRPVLLVGGGLDRSESPSLLDFLHLNPLPVMTTWNGADRLPSDHPNYCGRPNTWGQRWSNIVLQQADVVLALGTRLGLQQTGFNWQEFAPRATVIQVDIDPSELDKGHPRVDFPVCADANELLRKLSNVALPDFTSWNEFALAVRDELPLSEHVNKVSAPYINSFDFVENLSRVSDDTDIVIPCSSGGAFTVMMQAFSLKGKQRMLTNKGLASMGYGLAGAIGASLANVDKRTILVEGDGGFCQNLQELATVARHSLPIKMFIFSNNGYASIRMTQKNYFGGDYLGCDISTGLGFPDWRLLASAFGIEYLEITPDLWQDSNLQASWTRRSPSLYIVPIDPEQTYFPKISSRVTANGSMESAPLHLMTPELPIAVAEKVFRFLSN